MSAFIERIGDWLEARVDHLFRNIFILFSGHDPEE